MRAMAALPIARRPALSDTGAKQNPGCPGKDFKREDTYADTSDVAGAVARHRHGRPADAVACRSQTAACIVARAIRRACRAFSTCRRAATAPAGIAADRPAGGQRARAEARPGGAAA